MQSRSYYFLLAVLGMGLLAGFLFWKTNFVLGLDVKGGVRFTYEVQPIVTPDGKKPVMEDVLNKTQTILGNRISGLGMSEATTLIKGGNQVVVEIPGYGYIDKAQQLIGTSASLKAYWAKNVSQGPESVSHINRRYNEDDSTSGSSDAPSVDFTDTFTNKTIKPADPEYASMIAGWDQLATGGDLVKAEGTATGNGKFVPSITLNDQAGERIHAWTSAHRDQAEKIAFVLDGKVLQIAPVKKGEVFGKQFQVDGPFSTDYVKNLTNLLNAGSLPADLKLLSSEKVDPTIGSSALHKMIVAGTIAFAVISLFLIIYYSLPGFVALIALMLYVLFTLTVLKLMDATFSLAAIAGFVLSVGMAVDANILVFERFKEEIKKGKPLHNALDLGFKRALPAIIDSNSCTILTSMVLYTLGTGPVKGFAITLIIGVLISLFTAVTVTRSLLFFLTDSGAGNNPNLYGLNRNWFGEHLESEANTSPLQIVNNARKWFGITIVVIIAGTVCIAMKGLKPGVEFTGGSEAVYERTAGFPSAKDISTSLEKAGVRGTNVKFGTSSNAGKQVDLAYITIPGAALDKYASAADKAAFLDTSAGLPDWRRFRKSLSTVGPVIQKETTQNAIVGVIASFALIIVYLGFRFGLALGSFTNGLRFGFSAIIAGAKDIYVILGVAAAFGLFKGWELSSLFITAMLTVIGFSVHDKIVIFDRVRENLRHPLQGETFDNLMNRSVTQSFARSINTAAAVCAMLLILILFGTTTPELSFFCVTMLAGIAWGTYSSIYTAAPVLSLWEKYVAKHKGEESTLLFGALAEIARHRRVRSVGVPVAPVAPTPDATQPPAGGQRSYGQVRRRASAVERSARSLDDDE